MVLAFYNTLERVPLPDPTSLPQVRTSGTGWSVGFPCVPPGPGPPGRAGPESRAEVLLSSPPAPTVPTPLCRATWTLRDSECGGGSAPQSGRGESSRTSRPALRSQLLPLPLPENSLPSPLPLSPGEQDTEAPPCPAAGFSSWCVSPAKRGREFIHRLPSGRRAPHPRHNPRWARAQCNPRWGWGNCEYLNSTPPRQLLTCEDHSWGVGGGAPPPPAHAWGLGGEGSLEAKCRKRTQMEPINHPRPLCV